MSLSGDAALTIRGGLAGDSLQLIRVVPLALDLRARAGPYICAPTRAGLTVTFHGWRSTDADATLH
jgi:regulation of enolase protein 1 (concanavalin A-like superfamily)